MRVTNNLNLLYYNHVTTKLFVQPSYCTTIVRHLPKLAEAPQASIVYYCVLRVPGSTGLTAYQLKKSCLGLTDL